MPIPPTASLAGQMHCMSHDGKVVITAQRWTDPAARRPRSWLRLVRNGKAEQTVPFTGAAAHREMIDYWNGLAERYRPTELTEDQMWARLWDLAMIEQTECAATECAGRMPVAWKMCPTCGRPASSGEPAAVRGRRPLMLDLRKRQS
jgi:hypothetical protein